eukprot:g81310.t1
MSPLASQGYFRKKVLSARKMVEKCTELPLKMVWAGLNFLKKLAARGNDRLLEEMVSGFNCSSYLMTDSERLSTFVETMWDTSILKVLQDYIRIPNQSPFFDPEVLTNGYQEKAVELMAGWVKKQNVPGLKIEVQKDTGRTPLIFIEIEGSEDSKSEEAVLMYGHMDKQPPLTEDWADGLGPYTPVIKDNRLYGRGGADDGYAIFAAVCAVKALKEQKTPHARIVILIEGGEESGSPDLSHYMTKLKSRIGEVGLVVCLDSGACNYEQMWLTTSLRVAQCFAILARCLTVAQCFTLAQCLTTLHHVLLCCKISYSIAQCLTLLHNGMTCG